MPCYSPLKGWKDAETGGIVFNRNSSAESMAVACGQCLGCRLDRSRMWACRMVHEAEMHADTGGNSFITLTYRDRVAASAAQVEGGFFIPDDWSLKKDHFQKFMKRLRKSRPDARIKFYHCGEYGARCKHGLDLENVGCPLCNVGRPHYHAILFNCSFDDLEAYATQKGVVRYTSPTLESLWKYGFVDVGSVTVQSCGYVARYIMKKVNGVNAPDHYTSVDLNGEVIDVQPEYSTMSNGIGSEWYSRYKSDVFPSNEMPVPGSGIDRKIPRYYDEKLRAEDPELYEFVKLRRLEYIKEHPEEVTPQRLYEKYRVKKASVSTLSRDLV